MQPTDATLPREAKRKASPQKGQEKKKAIRHHAPKYMYGLSTSQKIVRDICAGCCGERNNELKDDPIVLCDGKDCGREYHLQCCLPPLTLEEVPEGSYLCIDCDPDGTSSQLEEYFDECWEERAKFANSRAFVAWLFNEVHDDNPIPLSEFPRMNELHRDALSSARNIQASPVPKSPLRPDFLIGKPVRLYFPGGNNYHNGRIIDWRRATHLKSAPSSSDAHSFLYGDISEIACCEFLVTFPAGLDFRKRAVHQWLILEEHSLAVGASLVWAFDERKKDWFPGMTWLRTSLELIPILDRLSMYEDDGQVVFDVSKIKKTKSWGLTQVFGKQNFLLLLLKEEAVDMFSPSMAGRFSREFQSLDGRIDTSVMRAHLEIDEQRRVRSWSKLPLQNVAHERAISIVDQYMLPPLQVTRGVSSEKQDEAVVELGPRPCPLIRRGLDRMWIMQQSRSNGQTKDAVADITVKGVHSRADAIQRLQQQTKTG